MHGTDCLPNNLVQKANIYIYIYLAMMELRRSKVEYPTFPLNLEYMESSTWWFAQEEVVSIIEWTPEADGHTSAKTCEKLPGLGLGQVVCG